MASEMKRVNFHLTNAQIGELQAMSRKTGLSVAELIRRAVDALLRDDVTRERHRHTPPKE